MIVFIYFLGGVLIGLTAGFIVGLVVCGVHKKEVWE